jgi:putative endonuclease
VETGAWLYILRCADGSYYVGTTIAGLERRMAEHQAGTTDGYTAHRRPVELVFHYHFSQLMMRPRPNGRSKDGDGIKRRR